MYTEIWTGNRFIIATLITQYVTYKKYSFQDPFDLLETRKFEISYAEKHNSILYTHYADWI